MTDMIYYSTCGVIDQIISKIKRFSSNNIHNIYPIYKVFLIKDSILNILLFYIIVNKLLVQILRWNLSKNIILIHLIRLLS